MTDLTWHTDDRTRLLRQNAAQVLDIVKETFPSHNFDKHSRHLERPKSDGEILESLWHAATTSEGGVGATPKEELQALFDVNYLREARDLWMLTRYSSQDTPRVS